MTRYLVVRLYSMALTIVGLTVLIFLMLRLIPGTVVEQMIGADAVVSPAMVAELKRFFGLDQPWYLQYGRWIGQLAQGDLRLDTKNAFGSGAGWKRTLHKL